MFSDVITILLTAQVRYYCVAIGYSYYQILGVRDYIHVVDLAKGHLAAFSALESKGFKTFNLGTGKGTSVLEMVSAFRKASGQPIPTIDCERRAGDVAWMWERFHVCYYWAENT